MSSDLTPEHRAAIDGVASRLAAVYGHHHASARDSIAAGLIRLSMLPPDALAPPTQTFGVAYLQAREAYHRAPPLRLRAVKR